MIYVNTEMLRSMPAGASELLSIRVEHEGHSG